jgi:HSP20 family molecular chaperone IbpA
MTDRKRPTGEDPFAEIARGLEGLMGQFGSVLGEAMSRLGEGEGSASHHSRVFDTGSGPVRAEIGLRVRGLGADLPAGTFRARTAPATGDRAQSAPPEAASDTAPSNDPDAPRTIVLSGYVDRGGWTLAADLPGVDPEDVRLDLRDRTLHVVTTGPRRYQGSADLPAGIDTATMTVTVRNGVLSVRFPTMGDTPESSETGPLA